MNRRVLLPALLLAALLPRVVEAEGILTSPRRVQVCHRDLWADNVRRTPAGGLVALDLENSGPGDVNGELGCALFEYGLGERDRMRTLYAAYVDAGGPGRLAGRGDLTMLVAQLGNIARVEALDERTVRIVTKRPDPVLIKMLAYPGAAIVPKRYFQEVGFDAWPTDLDGMLKVTQALAAKGKPGGLALGNAVGDGNGWCHWLVWSFGGKMVDENDQVVHSQLVRDIGEEPDYDAALAALR